MHKAGNAYMMQWYYHVLFWFFIGSVGPLYKWYMGLQFMYWYHHVLLGVLVYFSVYVWKWHIAHGEDVILRFVKWLQGDLYE